jgi:hypothetical protein
MVVHEDVGIRTGQDRRAVYLASSVVVEGYDE